MCSKKYVTSFLACMKMWLVQSNADDIAIFYNIYIPPRNRKFRTLNIVKEQLEFRENSIAPNGPLYYVTIGKDIGKLENCNNCEKIKHYTSGDEVNTLSHLYEYCSTNQEAKVAYMHNKGSFHYSPTNTKFRNMLTKALF